MRLPEREISSSGRRHSLCRDESGGVALVMVMWVMIVLVAIVGEFAFSMRTELNITRNFKEEEEAYQLALAGIEMAKVELLSMQLPALVYLNNDDVLVFDEEEEEPVREERLGRGSYKYTFSDEDSKLNINAATIPQLKNLLLNVGVDFQEVDTIIDSIVDWRDSNDLHMLNGAEEDYYRSLEKPYSAKDAPFDSVEELLLVRGMTPEILFGVSTGDAGDEEGQEEQTEEETGEETGGGIAQYLTAKGSSRININTASRVVLETLFGEAQANNIMTDREEAPIPRPISGGAVTSSVFSVVSTGSNADGTIKRSVKAIISLRAGSTQVLHWNDNYAG